MKLIYRLSVGLIFVWLTGICADAYCQLLVKRLPRIVNMPGKDAMLPFISPDGRTLYYLSNYSSEERFQLMLTKQLKPDLWSKPEDIWQGFYKGTLDYRPGIWITPDGKNAYLTSRRSPGIGKYDIWMLDRGGTGWGNPRNLGKPLNSSENEGSPSLSPDGKFLYFMRCGQMDEWNASECRIMIAERKGSTWSTPVELPIPINTGNELHPMMLSDNQTLLFCSDRPGGKGGLDFYISRKEGESWSEPVAWEFLNTADDDHFVSVPAQGDRVFLARDYKGDMAISMAPIPRELQPRKVLVIQGTATDAETGAPATAWIQAYDVNSNEMKYSSKINSKDGSFVIMLAAGPVYDFSIYPQDNNTTFFSQLMDLEVIAKSHRETMEVSLTPLQSGIIMDLRVIRFEDYKTDLKDESNLELRRLMRLMQKNPGIKFEIGAFIDEVLTDSVQSSPDLTEVIIDTIFHEVAIPPPPPPPPPLDSLEIPDLDSSDGVAADSMMEIEGPMVNQESMDASLDLMEDTVAVEPEPDPFELLLDSLESVGYLELERDEETIKFYKIKYTYHNDRTQQQAQAIVDFMVSKGAPPSRLEPVGYGDDWDEDKASEERNYWIEAKIIE